MKMYGVGLSASNPPIPYSLTSSPAFTARKWNTVGVSTNGVLTGSPWSSAAIGATMSATTSRQTQNPGMIRSSRCQLKRKKLWRRR